VLFIGFWASASTVDYVLVAPEAVAVTIETAEGLDVPVEFDSPDDA
jgi:hypothetical protein